MEQKCRPQKQSRLDGKQNFSLRNKHNYKIETKFTIGGIHQGNTNLNYGTNQDYMGNKS
jgi:hypothetical protein